MTRKTHLLMLISCTLLLLTSAVLAADGPPSTFYVYMYQGGEGDYDLVEVNTQTDTLTKILSVDSERTPSPLTLEQFSSLEWQAFQTELSTNVPAEEQQRVRDEMNALSLAGGIQSIRQTADGAFLIERQFAQCFSIASQEGPPLVRCYGGYVFSLLDITTQQERVVWSLPYHAGGTLEGNGCYTNTLYENYSGHEAVDQVLLHPTRPLMVVRLWSFGGCAHTAFIIDYTTETVDVKELSNITSVVWSPDASEIAYVEDCGYGTLDLTTFEQTPLTTAAPTSLCDLQWIAWPAPDTLIFTRAISGDTVQQTLVWHNRATGEESTLDLPAGQQLFYALSVQDADSTTILGIGDSGIGYMSHPNVALDAGPGVFLAEEFSTPSDPRSASRAYVFGEGGFLDADLNLYTVDLEPYRERYGADQAALAIVGVAQP